MSKRGKTAKKIEEKKINNQKINGNIEKSINYHFMYGFFMIIPFLCGGFYEEISCLSSIFLTGYLLYCFRVQKVLKIRANITLFMLMILVLVYGISGIWAVDQGMAFLGFIKFFPLLLFALVLMQMEREEKTVFWDIIPFSGTIMTVLSYSLGQVPIFKEYFFVNGRLAGFFQYPNTYALFLIAGVVVMVGKDTWNKYQIACFVVLLSGVVLTGSRTAFFILVAVIVSYVFFYKNQKKRMLLLLPLVAIVIMTTVYALFTGNVSTVGRYLTSSVYSSTFLGRLLYFKDALPVILHSPLGLGYKGYYYLQGSFQTGVYSVLNIHNELLQVFLDVGWVPAILFVVSIMKSFLLKQTKQMSRILIFAISAHCMFDFDLQFIVIGFILILAMDLETGKTIEISLSAWIRIVMSVLIGINCWFGMVSLFYHCGEYEMATVLYPGYTDAWIELLSHAESGEEMECLADRILVWNKSVPLAYSAKARNAYAEGDIDAMIQYKQKAISFARYDIEEYLDYFDMLYIGIMLYEEAGDENSAEYCRQKLLEIPYMLEDVKKETDELAYQIADKPELELPDEYLDRIDLLMR